MRFTRSWLALLTLVGCVAPTPDPDFVVTPCPPLAADGGAAPAVYDFAITTLTIDDNTSAAMPHTGFNLDGRFTPATMQQPADCDHRDYFSTLDPDQNENGCTGGTTGCRGGVDNQLPELAGALLMLTDVRSALRSEVAGGRLVRIVRLIGLDAPPGEVVNDDEVLVEVHRGVAMFSDCAQIGTEGMRYALDGRNRAGVAGSLVFCARARVVNGRLRTLDTQRVLTAVPLPVSAGYADVNLFALRPRLGVSLAAGQGSDGNLGGVLRRGDLLQAMIANPETTYYRTILEGLINGLIDVQTGDPLSCDAPSGAVSIGYGFQMVRATVLPQLELGPPFGMCGAN